MILFDTTFLIDLVSSDAGALEKSEDVDERGDIPAISVISVHEYLLGVQLEYHGRSRLNGKIESARRDLSGFKALPLNLGMAQLSSRLHANAIKKGRLMEMNDIYIAATALYYGVELISWNVKHFEQIGGLHLGTY